MPIQRDSAHYVVWNNFIIVVVSEGLPMRGALSKTEAGRDFNMAETHSLQDLRQQAAIAAKVFVQRDYSSGTICQFQTKFPSELENRIDRQQFEETIRALNSLYAEAEKLGGKSYLEGCLACLTAYTVFLCMETHYEKVLKKIGRYIQEQNDKVYAPRGLLLTDPLERGLRVVEITIFEDRSS
ncbi:golgin subfamily A member 7-like [Anguilla rostrata]